MSYESNSVYSIELTDVGHIRHLGLRQVQIAINEEISHNAISQCLELVSDILTFQLSSLFTFVIACTTVMIVHKHNVLAARSDMFSVRQSQFCWCLV